MKREYTFVLNLSAKERAALEKLCKRKELNKTAVLRQALRLYELVDARGGQIQFAGELQKKSELVIL